jgi:hypothetical protein
LGSIVETEARRVLSEAQLRPDPDRVANGWERRFIADATRTKEAIELYESLGFEVVADPIRTHEMGEECDDCVLVALMQFRTIYTRKKDASDSEDGPPE